MVQYLFARGRQETVLVFVANAVLTDAGGSPNVKAKVGNPFNVKTFPTEKETVLDISAEENSRKFMSKSNFWKRKRLLNAAFAESINKFQ